MLIYPVLDDSMKTQSMQDFADTPIWDNRNNLAMWNQYLTDRVNVSSYAAPARATSLEGLPAAYILSAEFDPLRDEAIQYGLRLLQSGVSVELHQVAGAYHGFDQQVADAAISRRVLNSQILYLKQFLRA
jgi:acetyl esterase/lipase